MRRGESSPGSVVADEGANAAERRAKYGNAKITGFEEQILLVPQVHLTEGPHVPGWADHDGGIVESLPVTLVDPGDDMEAVLTRSLLPAPGGWPGRDLFGEAKSLFA